MLFWFVITVNHQLALNKISNVNNSTMKKIISALTRNCTIVVLLLVVVFLMPSCSKDIGGIVVQPNDRNQNVLKDIELIYKSEESGFRKGYTLKNSFNTDNSPKGLIFKFLKLMKTNPTPEKWKNLHELVEVELNSFENKEKEIYFTIDIQEISYRMLKKYLFKAPVYSGDTEQAITYYMDYLVTHKGVDLDIMTDAYKILCIQNKVKEKSNLKCSVYSDYIKETAKKDILLYSDLIKKTKELINKKTEENSIELINIEHYKNQFNSAQYAIDAIASLD